jgi:isopentenyl-diphosphate delta-isomerase
MIDQMYNYFMDDELLDLVNENDVVIGEVARSKANADKSLIHREIGVIILNGKQQVLIQRRSFKKKTHPGLWIISVAGHVQKGIEPLEAAHKELREELGFDTELTFSHKTLEEFDTERHWAYVYMGKYEGQTIVTDPRETEAVMFVDQSEVLALKKQNLIEPHSAELILQILETQKRDD